MEPIDLVETTKSTQPLWSNLLGITLLVTGVMFIFRIIERRVN